jgi:hypothetical protein
VDTCHILAFLDTCNLFEAQTVKFALALAAVLIVSIPLPGQDAGAGDSLKSVGIDHLLVGEPIRIVRVMEGDTQIVPRVPSRRPNGQPFQAGEDWLKDLTFVVKNLSGKEIIAFGFHVDFPETGDDVPPANGAIEGNYTYSKSAWVGRQPAMYVLVHVALHAVDSFHPPEFNPFDPHGLHPPSLTDLEFAPREADTTSPPIDILPGQELSVPLAPYNDEIREGTDSPDRPVGKGKRIPFSAITTCWIFLQNAYFADGTKWTPGPVYYKPDPNAPGKYAKYVPIAADEFENPTR